jgi:hypothetical protein
VHALALALMALVLAPGTEAQADPAARAAYVLAHATAWRLSWLVWMASALTLLAFHFWWARRVARLRFALLAVAVAAVGASFDLRGESLYAFALPRLAGLASYRPDALADFVAAQGTATRLTAIWANAFYTAGGVLLTARSRLRGLAAALAWTAWAAGVALSVAGVYDTGRGMAIASAVLFPAFIALSALLPRALASSEATAEAG